MKVVHLTGMEAAFLVGGLALVSLNLFPQARQAQPQPASRLTQAVGEGTLTYTARNQPLQRVLEEIRQQTGLTIVIARGVGNEQISVEFRDFRLDEALRQVLKEYDTFFFYGAENGKEAGLLKAVWVYPASRGRSLKPVPPDAWTSTQELERNLASSNPETRAWAIENLIERKGQEAGAHVMRALRDPSDLVRTRTLDRALGSDLEVPRETLIDLALSDKSVNVRFLALEALSEDPSSSRWVAERATQDPSEHIRETARDILRQLDPVSAASSQSHGVQQRVP